MAFYHLPFNKIKMPNAASEHRLRALFAHRPLPRIASHRTMGAQSGRRTVGDAGTRAAGGGERAGIASAGRVDDEGQQKRGGRKRRKMIRIKFSFLLVVLTGQFLGNGH